MKNPLNIPKYFPYIFRRRFKEKYIIIESDDWGLHHSKSIEGVEYIRKKYGYEKFTRWTTDSLETIDDISLLYQVLLKYNNHFESPPKLTANFITHNIDYNNLNSLSFQPLSVSLKEDPILYEKYIYGIENKIFHPQLHGYCHYNTKKLENFFHSSEGKKLFNIGFLGGKSTLRGNLSEFRSEFSIDNPEVEEKIKHSIKEFYTLFNYYPISIIPPHFILDQQYFNILKVSGLKSIQASNRLETSNGKKFRKIYFRKKDGFIWIPRNARLDPHPDYNFNADSCLWDIDKAFEGQIPAIIDFHRVNISGRYNPKYRDKSLKELEKVFQTVLERWPETQFITTEKLINLCQV